MDPPNNNNIRIIIKTEIPFGIPFLFKNNKIGKVKIVIKAANKNGIRIGLATFIPAIITIKDAQDKRKLDCFISIKYKYK